MGNTACLREMLLCYGVFLRLLEQQRRENQRGAAVAALGREGAPAVLPLLPSLSCPFTPAIELVWLQRGETGP